MSSVPARILPPSRVFYFGATTLVDSMARLATSGLVVVNPAAAVLGDIKRRDEMLLAVALPLRSLTDWLKVGIKSSLLAVYGSDESMLRQERDSLVRSGRALNKASFVILGAPEDIGEGVANFINAPEDSWRFQLAEGRILLFESTARDAYRECPPVNIEGWRSWLK